MRGQARRAEVEDMVRPAGCDCVSEEICDYCGCCAHSDGTPNCIVMDATAGMRCPGSGCGCEGQS